MIIYFKYFQLRIGRRRKFFIYINFYIFRVIHGNQFDLICIDGFPKLFSHLYEIFAIFLMKQFPRNFQVFFRSIRKCISLFTTHNTQGHTQGTTPHHVFHKHIFLPIPGIEERATTFELLLFYKAAVTIREKHVLRNAIRPQYSDYICFSATSHTKMDVWRSHYLHLIQVSGTDFDFGANAKVIILSTACSQANQFHL